MYSIGILILEWVLILYGRFNPGIKDWNKTRKKHFKDLEAIKSEAGSKDIYWIHCASLGEFEQARPIIDALHSKVEIFTLLTFFSPSGYRQKHSYAKADRIIYLPIDTASTAKRFVEVIAPKIFIGVKYEFWWNYFRELNQANIKKVLICLKFDASKYFIRKKFFRKILLENSTFFTQNETTKMVLTELGASNVFAVGDTRVDSVLERAKNLSTFDFLNSGKKIIVYGSIYPNDMDVLAPFINNNQQNYQHILVPHKIDGDNIDSLTKDLLHSFTLIDNVSVDSSTIIINKIGLLFDLYPHAHAVYIGGGFNKSVHNTLEPAAFGMPIALGPNFKGFVETETLVENGGLVVVKSPDDILTFIHKTNSATERSKIEDKLATYFKTSNGASIKILKYLSQIEDHITD